MEPPGMAQPTSGGFLGCAWPALAVIRPTLRECGYRIVEHGEAFTPLPCWIPADGFGNRRPTWGNGILCEACAASPLRHLDPAVPRPSSCKARRSIVDPWRQRLVRLARARSVPPAVPHAHKIAVFCQRAIMCVTTVAAGAAAAGAGIPDLGRRSNLAIALRT